MKIVNIIGGLGNQMFQYAFAISLAEKFSNEAVYIDISHFHHIFVKKWKSANLHNGYEIGKVFPYAKLPVASARQIMKVSRYIPNYLLSRLARKYLPVRRKEFIQKPRDYFKYNPSVYNLQGDWYYEGIWESVSYLTPIRNKIQDVYRHPKPNKENASVISQMEQKNSVGIHIRRGDYLQAIGFSGICDLDYYKKAIDLILSDGLPHSFFIFSNDIRWCEENIRTLVGDNEIMMVTFNTGASSCWDMFLMTHCKDLIIANSTFSWWGAFLNNRGGRVVTPQKWMTRKAEFDIWLPEWIKI